jgi:anhydro-N-acetylmuramic acid kinase
MLILGLMSGTSLDGLDLAICEFERYEGEYRFKIKAAKTSLYSALWKNRLTEIKNVSAEAYFEWHALYGKYIAEEANTFLKATGLKPDAIASHGHTVFHQPALGFSTQVGCGATIASYTQTTTVYDFRSLDVASGGQGAPLVPIGDKLLFGNYAACLNIGGIANISFDDLSGKRTAFDICEANMLLNYLAEKTGKAFDRAGEMARSGKVNDALLNKLNAIGYYSQKGAKSIGREWFEKNILYLVDDKNMPVNDLLATSTEHIAQVIANELNDQKIKNVLLTGGGVFNTFLVERVKLKTSGEIIIPKDEIINFKEALIFAFLGYLRLNNSINTLRSVTGALNDSIGGAVYRV